MNELEILKAQVAELMAWKNAREIQQLHNPLDDASKNLLGVASDVGAGSTSLTQVYTDSGADTHTGPKAFAGSRIINLNGSNFEFPYIA